MCVGSLGCRTGNISAKGIELWVEMSQDEHLLRLCEPLPVGPEPEHIQFYISLRPLIKEQPLKRNSFGRIILLNKINSLILSLEWTNLNFRVGPQEHITRTYTTQSFDSTTFKLCGFRRSGVHVNRHRNEDVALTNKLNSIYLH
jgi:hypothetical protein